MLEVNSTNRSNRIRIESARVRGSNKDGRDTFLAVPWRLICANWVEVIPPGGKHSPSGVWGVFGALEKFWHALKFVFFQYLKNILRAEVVLHCSEHKPATICSSMNVNSCVFKKTRFMLVKKRNILSHWNNAIKHICWHDFWELDVVEFYLPLLIGQHK